MKKYLRYIFLFLYVTVILIGVWQSGKYIEKQKQMINELQNRQEELQREYTDAENQYVKSNNKNGEVYEQIVSMVQENQKLEERLLHWEKTRTGGSGFFYGHWMIDILYKIADNEEKEYCKDITFQNDYIYVSGNYAINDPVYSVAMRWGDDIWGEMEQMGFSYGEMMDTGLFHSDYYVEMELDDSENRNREIKEEEADFLQGAKYYLLDQETMICMTQKDGGKVYILRRD